MDKVVPVSFQQCYTCGRWHPVPGAYSGRFCSRECAAAYRRCPVCGEYFPANNNPDGTFCSAECIGVDRKDRPTDMMEIFDKQPESRRTEMKLIFLGPPGAGKGTMAARTRDFLGVPHISTGNLFRENIAGGTALGLKVKAYLDRGNLVPDELTVAMVEKRLDRPDTQNGFILDGFPRTIFQAEALSGMAAITHVLNLVCPDEELMRRLTGRRFCPACGRSYHVHSIPPQKENICDDDGTTLEIRNDDTPEAVANRLKVYTEKTSPLIAWYKERNLLYDIQAEASPDIVFERIRKVLES